MGNNLDIRAYAKSKGVFMYEIARELNISEPTIMRWLRNELADDCKAKIISSIDAVAAQRANNAATAAN